MPVNNTIHRIEFASKKHVVYGKKITIDATTDTIDDDITTIDGTAEKFEI